MNNVHAGQKWEVAAGLLCEAGGLHELVPVERRAEVTRSVARAMRDGYESNHPDKLGHEAAPVQYAEAGNAAVRSGMREVNLYRSTYGAAELTVDRVQGPQTDAPRATRRGREGGGSEWRSGMNDLDCAMALHGSAAPPLAGVRRLDPSEHGSRRETAGHGAHQQPRGPERGS